MNKDKEIKQYGWIIGLWIMIVIPLAIFLIFGWKWALGFFVISQTILMLARFIKLHE